MKKYRPVLTTAQILHLVSLCKNPSALNHPLSLSCISTLAPFLAKIENDGLKEAYTLKEQKRSKLDDLGFSAQEQTESLSAKRERLYNEWVEKGESFDTFSPREIQDIQTYRYENDMMSESEVEDFEASTFTKLFSD